MRSNFVLTANQKVDTRAALAILDGAGITLEQAARLAVEKHRSVERLTVEQAAEKFLLSRAKTVRTHTFYWYESKVGIFVTAFGKRQMDAINRPAFRAWLAEQPVSESTKCAYVRAVRSFWNWAINHEPPLAVTEITHGLPVTPQRTKTIQFLPVAEAEAALTKIPDRHRSALALMLFAGIRPHEVAGLGKPHLPWKAINVAEKIIRVPAECAKTGRARIIEELPEAVWRWIGTPGEAEQPVSRTLAPEIIEKTAEAAGYGGRCTRTRKWPQDALRHTFATYAVALTADPGKVSLWLGHQSPAMLHRHYRGLTTKAEAEKFFALKPKTEPSAPAT